MAKKLTRVLIEAEERRGLIRDKAINEVKKFFPVEGSRYDVDVENVHVKSQDYSTNEEKQAILEGKTLYEPIRGNITLRDKQGQVLDKKRNATLLNLPWFTGRHTFIVDGNEYNVANQVRLKPGIYTRRKGNEELEAQFNVLHLYDNNFKVNMDPETGHMKLKHGTTNIPLYPVLSSLGVPNASIARSWGKDLAAVNADAFQHKREAAIKSLYNKLTPEYLRDSKLDHEGRVSHIRQQYDKTYLDPDVTKRTLGVAYNKVSPNALLRTSEKLLNIYKQAEEVDDRDSLANKTLHQAEDFIAERIKLDGRLLRRKVGQKLDHATDLKVGRVVPTGLFTSGIRKFLTMSDLSSIPTQINQLEIIDSSQKITSLGEGGIGSERAIPVEARNVHPTHIGIIDTVRTPETGKVGVDLRAAVNAARDYEGNMYTPLRNARTMKAEYLPTKEVDRITLAFHDQVDRYKQRKSVEAIQNGQVKAVPHNEVDYFVMHPGGTYSPATNLVPFIESMQGNRAIMASKHLIQALPLKEKEVPFVQVGAGLKKYDSMEHVFGKSFIPRSPINGVVDKIDKNWIYIRPTGQKTAARSTSGNLAKVPYYDNFPLATKTYLHNNILVEVGDRVKKDQYLADSNNTLNGTLALGKNLNVGIMAYQGMNSNDAVVISEGAAKKLTSLHTYKEHFRYDTESIKDKNVHKAHFGNRYTVSQYTKLDSDGVVKVGQTVEYKDPLIVCVAKAQLTSEASMLGRLHKSLVKPYREYKVLWEHNTLGKVIDVVKTDKAVTVVVKTEEPMGIGDKLTGRHGNKGVVSRIVSDEQMPRGENGDPLDVLQTSASVISRINPSQILEMAIGKVAQKTGKPIPVPQFTGKDNVKWAKKLLKDHGVKDKETVFDPIANKKIKGINVGPMYIMKLMKTTGTNYSARGVEGYDTNQQPSTGGAAGAKGIGKMEFAALIAHDARNVIKENAVLKSQKNDEYWQRVRLGLPPTTPKTTFAYDRFGAMLTGMGVKHDKEGNYITLSPLTDNDITKMSNGPIENSLALRAKDLKPERGGLFDEVLTGGASGTKFTHINLNEPIVNPLFIDPARRLLDMTGKEFTSVLYKDGAKEVKKRLNRVDLAKKGRELKKLSQTAQGAKLNDTVKQLKYINGLRKQKLRAGDAYVLSKIPVTPPITRPILPSATGSLLTNAANYLYRDVMLANDGMKAIKDLPEPFHPQVREHLHDSVSALFGLQDPVSPQNKARGAKGFMTLIAGKGGPKYGYVHDKLIKKQLDLSGRGTASPDVNLNMDEIALPIEMGWKMYEPFVVGRLVRRGYRATLAKQMWEDRHPAAKEELLKESKARPVYYNRAPSLHKHSILGAYPKFIPGKTIRVPATWPEEGMNLDYDGDALQIHLPATPQAVQDVKRMTLPNLLFSDKSRGDLLVQPMHEAIIGLYKGTSGAPSSKAVKRFKNRDAVLAAYRRGEVSANDRIEVGS